MRVLFLQQQPCIRTLKYAVALQAMRSDVVLAFAYRGRTLGEWYGEGDEAFESWWRLGPDGAGDLRRVLTAFGPDVIHSHNLPDALTALALDLTEGRVPVIHDVHDLQSLRHTPYEDGFPEPEDALALEKRAIEQSAAVIAVSEELMTEIRARHEAPPHGLVFPNYSLGRDLPSELEEDERRGDGLPRLVYQGTLSTNGGHYDLREIFTAIAKSSVRLDIYPAREHPGYAWLADGHERVRWHATLSPQQLLKALPAYDFGWAGFNATVNGEHLDTVLPNKAFEYIGCGLPVLTLAHRALERFVREEGVGVSLNGLEDLDEQLAEVDLAALRRRVELVRPRLTVEANIGKLVDLYSAVAA